MKNSLLFLALVFSYTAITIPRPLGATAKDIFQNNQGKILLVRTHLGSRAIGNGTAFVVSYKGTNYLVTNFHVISAGRFYLEQAGRKIKDIKVLRVNDSEDIAVLTFAGIEKFASIPLDAHEASEGEKIYALGFPGISQTRDVRLTITDGLVSNSRMIVKREGLDDKRYVQISAAINPGNSGGPVFSDNGKLVGMATLKWINLSAVGAAIPAVDIIKEIGTSIEGPKSREHAVRELEKRFKQIALSVKGKRVLDFGLHYAPPLKMKIYPSVQKHMERVRHAARIAGYMDRTNSREYYRHMASYLTPREMHLYLVLNSYFRRHNKATLTSLLHSPVAASELYLSARFFYYFTKLSGVRGKWTFKGYKIEKVDFNSDNTRANVAGRIKLKNKEFTANLKFVYVWGNWFLDASY